MSTKQTQLIFITVSGGVAEVDWDTVPEGIEIEVIDQDDLESDERAPDRLSAEGRAYAEKKGYL